MRIGSHEIGTLLLAPMAGVTDQPFRELCRRLGAGLAPSEMLAADPRLWGTRKSRLRMVHAGEAVPRAVQIAGSDPVTLARAARFNAECGADIIDINMGCPATKVCKALAGSALLGDEALVGRILDAVVAAVEVPVTLKMRTGPDRAHRNGVRIARIAEAAGIAALAVHGRTRAERFEGHAEYDTIRDIRAAVRIPVIANGDIATPAGARAVLAHTGADALMIGRAAQGNPWIFREIAHLLATGRELPPPSPSEIGAVLAEHLEGLYGHYGERQGVRVARKHLAWYCRGRAGARIWWARASRVESAAAQLALAREFFETGAECLGRAA